MKDSNQKQNEENRSEIIMSASDNENTCTNDDLYKNENQLELDIPESADNSNNAEPRRKNPWLSENMEWGLHLA